MPQICHEVPSFLTLLRHLHGKESQLLICLLSWLMKHVLHIVIFAVVKHATCVGLNV